MPKKKTEISKEEKEAWQKKAMLRNNPVIFKDDCFTKEEIERTRG